jgi:protein-histidine N-methyltransferase
MAFSFNFYDDPAPKTQEESTKFQTSKPIQSVTLEDALQQLPDTLAYSLLGGLPRRELWHVKMQIMQNDQDTQLLGQRDVITGSYEGGLKTWECSVDLAEYLSHQTYGNELSVLEVACRLCGAN